MRAPLSYMSLTFAMVWSVSGCLGGGTDNSQPEDSGPGIAKCGNGIVEGTEDCDDVDLAGATCESVGLTGGTLKCNIRTCRFDATGCMGAQNHDNMCDRSLGCSSNDGTGTSGNPQSIVECFNQIKLTPPYFVTQVSYGIGTVGAPPPDALEIEVYEWSGSGQPGTLLSKTPVAAGDLTAGPHTVTLAQPVEVKTAGVCVGTAGTNPADGYKMLFSDSAMSSGTAWTSSTNCGNGAFQDVVTLLNSPAVTTGSWCITAGVTGSL